MRHKAKQPVLLFTLQLRRMLVLKSLKLGPGAVNSHEQQAEDNQLLHCAQTGKEEQLK